MGRLTKPRNGFRSVFDIFAAVDEGRSAMGVRARGKNEARRKTHSIYIYIASYRQLKARDLVRNEKLHFSSYCRPSYNSSYANIPCSILNVFTYPCRYRRLSPWANNKNGLNISDVWTLKTKLHIACKTPIHTVALNNKLCIRQGVFSQILRKHLEIPPIPTLRKLRLLAFTKYTVVLGHRSTS